MLQAQRLLETSDYSVDEVAGRCGFRSPVALRGHFRRQLGSSPAAYRAAYRARRPGGEPVASAAEQPVMPDRMPPGHTRRPQAAIAASHGSPEPARPGPDAYAQGRPALPGQRSAP